MRCFCLWQKRCACGAMCAFGTLRIAGRVRKRSVYAQQPRIRANALHLTLCVRLLAMSAAFDFRKCKRLLLSSLAVSREGSPPLRIQKQPRLRLFFGVPGGSRKEQSDEIAKRASLLAERSASRRVRLRSSVRFCLNARTPPPPYTKTTAVTVVFWCTRGESNPRHPASEAGALSN